MGNNGDLGVLIIYTGGTIGSVPRDEHDPLSALVPASLETIIEKLPRYDKMDKKITFKTNQVRLSTYSWQTPLDSSNITSKDWLEMAEVVRSNYDKYDGFVILHGTDTMAFTASALAFMFEHLSKPVVVTGSQLPIGETRSDAVQNLVTAIEIAAAGCLGAMPVPEVTVYFRDHLLRGCRTTKHSASDFAGFSTPNFPPLAQAGERIVYNQTEESSTSQRLRVVQELEDEIAALTIFPGMNPKLLRRMLLADGLKGVVLMTFGAGNAPSTDDFLEVVGEAVAKERLIIDVTQCLAGEAELGLYEVSAGLLKLGVVSGMDMTVEAALTKMAVVLRQANSLEEAADLMQINLRGEQRQSVFNIHLGAGEIDEDPIELKPVRDMVEGDRYNPDELERGVLRILGIELEGKRGRLEIDAYIDLPHDSNGAPVIPNKGEGPHYIGHGDKKWNPSNLGENIFIEATGKFREFLDGKRKPSITLVSESSGALTWSSASIALWTSK